MQAFEVWQTFLSNGCECWMHIRTSWGALNPRPAPRPGSHNPSLSCNWSRYIQSSIVFKSSPGDSSMQRRMRNVLESSNFQRPAVSASPGRFQQCTFLDPTPDLRNQKSGLGPSNLGLNKPCGWFYFLKFETPCFRGGWDKSKMPLLPPKTEVSTTVVLLQPVSTRSSWSSFWEAPLLLSTERMGACQVVSSCWPATKRMTTYGPSGINLNPQTS